MTEARLLQDKVVVVTGAGRGIGREIALSAAAEGAKVLVNDLGASLDGGGADQSLAAEVVALIRQAGGEAIANGDSVADAGSAERIIATAVEHYGRIDAVVNNAGILRDAIFHKLSVADFEAVVRVHLFGAFYMSHAAALRFREQNGGALVHMTSTSGLIGSIGQANYAAAKMGIVGLSRSIAMDMQRFNVRSNCIAPSAFSRMIESIPGQSPEEHARFIAMRKAKTRPDQIAPLAVFLCSDSAREVSGQIFGARGNEIYLYNQSRPIRTVHQGEGWTPARVAEIALPALQPNLTPLERTRQVFSWDAI
jgi:NAD(P)-dependent dehydrogenase (short-subunit alcohol dehydrogenase family)